MTNFSAANSTNGTMPSPSVVPFDYLYNTLIILDNVLKTAGFLVTLFYIVVLIFSKSLHKRTFMFLNHAAISNIFYETMMILYSFSTHPNVGNENINNILCSTSEIVWIFASFIRAYSMLLLAIYRYLATFHVNIFKRINQSMLCLCSMLASIYGISFVLPFIGKYTFGTSYSFVYCLDGNSPYLLNTILYLIYTYVFLIIIPVPTVIIIYARIMNKLNMLSSNVTSEKKAQGVQLDTASTAVSQAATKSQSKISLANTDSSAVDGVSRRSKKSLTIKDTRKLRKSYDKQKTFAYQLIFMCVALVASSFVLVIFLLRNMPNYFIIFYYFRPIFRIYLVLAMTIVPLTCLYYHPAKTGFLRRIKSQYQSSSSQKTL